MSSESVGFVGGGRITRVFLGGWARAGCMPKEIVVSDPNDETLSRLRQQFPHITIAPRDNQAAASQHVVLLAVHPPVLMETLPGIADALREEALVVSLAPKFTIAKISSLLGGSRQIARSIPNAPSLVDRGFNPICFASDLGPAERDRIRALFEPLGECPTVDEPKLEAYAILTAMGPTYFWPQFVELFGLAREFGLSDGEAADGLHAMVTGALAALRESNLAPDEVMDLVPVQPLASEMPALCEAYRGRLSEIYRKISP